MPLPSHDIDFAKLIELLLGNLHRVPIRKAWLTALFKPFETIHTKFKTYTDAKWEEVGYNGQTFVLERMLIKRFGAGIYITNNLTANNSLIIGDGSDWVSSIGDGSDWSSAIYEDFNPVEYSFTVNVPGAVVFVESEMRAWIEKYNANTFNIVIV